MATTYTDTAMGARAIGARTDAGATPVTDVSAEEDRMSQVILTPGWVKPANSFQPVAGSAATMDVVLGSGASKADFYAVEGANAGQGVYLVRLDATTVTVVLNAASGSFARKDEIYLVVADDAYDSLGVALPRLAYRDGTPSGSPAAPGPDAGWDAYELLATIDVPQSAADILACTITDERTPSTVDVGGVQLDDLGARLAPTGADPIATAAAGTIVPDDAAAVGSAATLARSDHKHAIAAATPGGINPDDSSTEGVSTSFARADHRHSNVAAAPTTTHTLSTANAEGAANSFARSDHTHAHDPADTADIAGVGTADAQGTNAEFARGDHVHGLVNIEAIGVMANSSLTTGGTLNASFADKASLTWTKPAGWNTARIVAWGTLSGIVGGGQLDLRVEIGASNGTTMRAPGATGDIYGYATHTATVSATSTIALAGLDTDGSGTVDWATITYIATRLT